MKIKGCVKKLNAKMLGLCFGIAGAAFTALHVWAAFTALEPDTGFFAGEKWLPLLYYGLLGAVAALTFVLFYLCPLSKAEYIETRRNIPHAVASLLMAAGFAVGAVQTLKSAAVSTDAGLSVTEDTVQTGLSGVASSRLHTLIAVLGFAACAALLVNAAAFLTGKDLTGKLKILQLFPALWALFRSLSYFSVTVSYIRVPALLISIFADVLLMIFMYEYARKISGVAGDGNSPIYLSTALLCALLQLCAGLASVVGYFPGHTAIVYADLAPYRFAAVVFCLSAVVLMLGNRVPDYAPEEEAALQEESEAPQAADGDENDDA